MWKRQGSLNRALNIPYTAIEKDARGQAFPGPVHDLPTLSLALMLLQQFPALSLLKGAGNTPRSL